MTTKIAPISAAQHYATSAQFWEAHCKLLQHQLDEANARIIALEAELAAAEPEPDINPS